MKNKEKQERALIAAEKRQFNQKRRQTKKAEKQTQNELKFAAIRLKQLVVKLQLSSTDSKQMNNEQMQTQKTIDETVISKENENAIIIISRDRRVRASKNFDA